MEGGREEEGRVREEVHIEGREKEEDTGKEKRQET